MAGNPILTNSQAQQWQVTSQGQTEQQFNNINPTTQFSSVLNQSNSDLIKMADAMKGINNPNELINKLAKDNPILQNVMNGGNPQQMVMDLIQKQGMDPSILSELQKIWNR